MIRRARRALARRVRNGRVIGRDPHTGKIGDLGKAMAVTGIGSYGELILVERNGKLRWIPSKDVFDSFVVNVS